jgi:hypothetical protein
MVVTPAEVAAQERFWPVRLRAGTDAASRAVALTDLVNVSPALGTLDPAHVAAHLDAGDLVRRRYAVLPAIGAGAGAATAGNRHEGSSALVHLMYHHDAGWREVILGYVHALALAQALLTGTAGATTAGSQATIAACVAARMDATADSCVQRLETAGWWVGQPLVEADEQLRVSVGVVGAGGAGGTAAEAGGVAVHASSTGRPAHGRQTTRS